MAGRRRSEAGEIEELVAVRSIAAGSTWRGKSGQRRASHHLTGGLSHVERQNSATENKPPPTQVGSKGENVW